MKIIHGYISVFEDESHMSFDDCIRKLKEAKRLITDEHPSATDFQVAFSSSDRYDDCGVSCELRFNREQSQKEVLEEEASKERQIAYEKERQLEQQVKDAAWKAYKESQDVLGRAKKESHEARLAKFKENNPELYKKLVSEGKRV